MTSATPPPLTDRPAGWLRDPLDDQMLRYWNGDRWTYWIAARPTTPVHEPEPDPPPTNAPSPGLRPDIAAARDRVAGALLGAGKEIGLLESHLRPQEHVVALTGALGAGVGVLACTNQRLLFLFVGILREQFLEVDWNKAREVIYSVPTKEFAVYTTKRTKRARAAFVVRVDNRSDAEAIAFAAERASKAPRLDIV